MKQFKSLLKTGALCMMGLVATAGYLGAACDLNDPLFVMGGSGTLAAAPNELRIINGTDGSIDASDSLPGTSNDARSVSWNAAGTHVVVGSTTSTTSGEVIMYEVCVTFNELAQFEHGAGVFTVDWSADCKFIAMGGTASGGVTVRVFDEDLNLLDSRSDLASGGEVCWRPDNNFLAAVASGADNITVYSFDGTTLAPEAQLTTGEILTTCDWSPDGKYLATGEAIIGSDLNVYLFDGVSTLTLKDTFTHGGNISELRWSPDGTHIAMVGALSGGVNIRVLKFDAGTEMLSTDDSGGDGTHTALLNTVSWFADSGAFVVGGSTDGVIQIRRFTYAAPTITEDTTGSFPVTHGNTVRSVDVQVTCECPVTPSKCDCTLDDCLVTSFHGNFGVDPCRKLLANFIDPVRQGETRLEEDDGTEAITCFSGNFGIDECRNLLVNRICPVQNVALNPAECTICDPDDRACEANLGGCLELYGDRVVIPGTLLVNQFGPFDETCLTKDGLPADSPFMRFQSDVEMDKDFSIAGNLVVDGALLYNGHSLNSVVDNLVAQIEALNKKVEELEVK